MRGAGPRVERDFRASRGAGARQVSLQGHVRVKLLPPLNTLRKSLVFQVKVLEGVPSSLDSGRQNRLHRSLPERESVLC